MQTTIVPEQVKIQKIQAGVQVSRLEDKDVIFSIGSALEDFILLYFVIVRNINLKLYDASCFTDSRIHVNIRDTEDILDDATKSQIKMKNKLKDPIAIMKKQNVCTIDYKKLNALYEDLVPQKEFSVEQKYFSSSFISFENPSNASSPSSPSETKPTVAPMPSANLMKLDLNKMENDFKTLFELLQTNSKRESKILYFSRRNTISKMKKLESENVSLEFQVQSLIKERENVKSENQKLFDSIKKTRTQTQCEINELIKHFNQKTHAYAEVRAQNQDLLITISELKAKLKKVEKGLSAASSARRPLNRDSPLKNSVLSNTKNHQRK
ncbi:hypothetical protein Tco_0961607 [Tanacetum coccineum]